MQEINYIVIHCTETISTTSAESIIKSWEKESGEKHPCYDYLVDNKGGIHPLPMWEKIADDVPDYYRKSVHVSYIGGVDSNNMPKDTRSVKQQLGMFFNILSETPISQAIIQGHRDFPKVHTTSPSFDVKEWYAEIQ